MGYIKHHAIIVTSIDISGDFTELHKKVAEIHPCVTSEITDAVCNGYVSFYTTPVEKRYKLPLRRALLYKVLSFCAGILLKPLLKATNLCAKWYGKVHIKTAAMLPDGSKEGWWDSQEGDDAREQIIEILKANDCEWVMLSYGGDDPEDAEILDWRTYNDY